MKLKFYKLTYLSLCMWNYAQAAIQITNDDISDVIDSCDYTRFDNQLIKLQIGNDILQHNMSNIQKDLSRQNYILSDLERTIKSLPQQIEAMQEKLMQNNKQNIEDFKDFIRNEIKMQATMVPPPVAEKVNLIADMRETLNKHDKMLDESIKNQNDSLARLNEINLDKHTQALRDTISEKLAIMPQIDDKLTAIENRTVPTDILNDVITYQENINSLLNEINLEKQNIISDKLAIMSQINVKLNQIENTTIPKAEHLKFYSDVHQYFHKTDAAKICRQDDNQTLTCTRKSYPTSCAEFDATICADNKCPIINYIYGPKPFVVACNNCVDDGGWTVDFYRDWLEYKHGFGDIDGEFFIGLDKLHALTSSLQPMELLIIELQDFDNVTKYAKYDDFQVGNETENYKLIKLGSYTGDAGDSFSQHVGYSFTTKDRDNDVSPTFNCAQHFTAAWWYFNCYKSNLNGKYYQHPTKFFNATIRNHGINWATLRDSTYSLKSVQMLIRPRKL